MLSIQQFIKAPFMGYLLSAAAITLMMPIAALSDQAEVSPPPIASSVQEGVVTAADKGSVIKDPVKVDKTLDLMDVYELSLTNDPRLKKTKLQLDSAKEEIIQARSGFLPQVSYSGNIGIISSEQDNAGLNTPTVQVDPINETVENRSASLSVRQTLFNKSIGSQLDSSKIASELSQYELDLVLQELQLNTAIAYLNLLQTQDALAAANKQLDNTTEQFTQAKERFDVGVGTITDFYQAQSRLSLANSDIVGAENKLNDAQQALLALTGVLITNINPLTTQYPVLPPQPNDIDHWVNTAMVKNIRLTAARKNIALSDEQIDLAKAEYWPTLNLAADQTHTRISNSEFLSGDTDDQRVFLQLEGKLYQGGRLNSQLRQAEIEHNASIYSFEDVERSVREATTNAFNDVNTSINQVLALKTAYISAEKTLQAREETFQVGLSTNLEVLDAIRDWFDARNNFLSARYQHAINLLQLQLQAGQLNVNDLQRLNKWVQESEADSNDNSYLDMEETVEAMNQAMRESRKKNISKSKVIKNDSNHQAIDTKIDNAIKTTN